MPSSQEVRVALDGAVQLLKLDKTGFSKFDTTLDGYWKSFFAILLVLPALLFAEATLGAGSAPLGARLARSSVNLVLHWMLFVTIALFLCRAVGMAQNYLAFITAYNWCSAVGAMLFMLPAGAAFIGVVTREGGQFLVAMISLYVIFYLWFAARTALDNKGALAVGFVFLDFCLNLIIDGLLGVRGG